MKVTIYSGIGGHYIAGSYSGIECGVYWGYSAMLDLSVSE